jgi:hypothetical protein
MKKLYMLFWVYPRGILASPIPALQQNFALHISSPWESVTWKLKSPLLLLLEMCRSCLHNVSIEYRCPFVWACFHLRILIQLIFLEHQPDVSRFHWEGDECQNGSNDFGIQSENSLVGWKNVRPRFRH